jgi:hypothetical protein
VPPISPSPTLTLNFTTKSPRFFPVKNTPFPLRPSVPTAGNSAGSRSATSASSTSVQCDATGKEIVSIYSPDKPFKVYHRDYWWSDKWNPLDYGRDFDFDRPFFEQFDELSKQVPKIALAAWDNENSEYVHDTANCKNCYLVFGSYEANDCAYSTTI